MVSSGDIATICTSILTIILYILNQCYKNSNHTQEQTDLSDWMKKIELMLRTIGANGNVATPLIDQQEEVAVQYGQK